MFIKTLSHLHKKQKHKNKTCFVVSGYPRSGTTMLSSLVGFLSEFYFDRDNIFPSTGKTILHTHWDPARFENENYLYIYRNPLDVHISALNYFDGNGWAAPTNEQYLKSKKLCRHSWTDHVTAAASSNKAMVNYDGLIDRRPEALDLVASTLCVTRELVNDCLTVSNELHTNNTHSSDLTFKRMKAKFTESVSQEALEKMQLATRDESALYKRLCNGDSIF